jgi:hypothetical protein
MIKRAFLGISVPVKQWKTADDMPITPDISLGFPDLVSGGVSTKKGIPFGRTHSVHPRLGFGLLGPTIGVTVKNNAMRKAIDRAADRAVEEAEGAEAGIGKSAMVAGLFDELGRIYE